MGTKPKSFILSGDGINCHVETAAACADAGFETRLIHVNDLLKVPSWLGDCDLFVLPGGFSFGDELGSGKILALKLKFGLKAELDQLLMRGGALLGICNGFQVLTRLGVFGARVALTNNDHGCFLNRWVGMTLTGKSIFTDGLHKSGVTRLAMPIRHGEGRLVFAEPEEARAFFDGGQCVLRYEEDVNGSWNQVAALSAYGGRVLGLMPHPEAFWTPELFPGHGHNHNHNDESPLGTVLFQNAFAALSERQ